MHDFAFPDYVIERVMAKRGRLRVFDAFAGSKTALVVIDMQHFYVAEVATARGIVPNINRLAHAVRDRGGEVVWACMTAGAGEESLWPLYHDAFFTPEKGRNHRESLTEGAPGHALWPELDALEDDTYVFKNRFSAFIQGACDLDEQLRSRGIENVLVCGTATNFCCETTARDAMMLGYRVAMVSDGCAARYDEDHAVGLTSVFQSFGDVLTTDEAITDLVVDDRTP